MTLPETPADSRVPTRAPAPAPRLQALPSRPTWAVALLVALVVTALAALALPHPPRLSDDTQGDPGLAADLRTLVGDAPVQGVAAVTGTGGTPTARAAVGRADARSGHDRPMTTATPQEIGSVTKSLTGLLFADAVARGEVQPTTTLGDVYPDRDLPPEVARITLDELATHTSGLPSLTGTRLLRGMLSNFSHGNPYAGQTPDGVLAEAAGTRLRKDSGEYSYSNLGVSLLGHALATRAGVPYAELLQQRILGPLGMTDTVATPARPPAGAAVEVAGNGLRAAPWTSEGGGPAGTGVWSTADDLGRLLAAVADGTAPGLDAITARAATDQDDLRTGWGWLVFEHEGRTLLLFNGETGGGVSSIALDTASREWVAVTAPSTANTQTVALGLLGVDLDQPLVDTSWRQLLVLVTLFLLAFFPLVALFLALRRSVSRPSQRLDRLRIVSEVTTLLLMTVLVRGMGRWEVVPPAAWLASVFVGTLAAALLLARWPSSTWPQERRRRRWVGGGAGVAVSAALVTAVLTGAP